MNTDKVRMTLRRICCMAVAGAFAAVVPAAAETVTDASSLTVAQRIADYGTRAHTDRESVIVFLPQVRNTSSLPATVAEEIQKAIVEDFGVYTTMIVFADSDLEAQINLLTQFAGVSGRQQQEERTSLSHMARYALIPVIERKGDGKFELSVTCMDVLTGLRRSVRTGAYSTSSALTASPGAADEAILLLCEELGVRLSDMERAALTEGEESLSPEDRLELSRQRAATADIALDELTTLAASYPEHAAFYNVRMAEQMRLLGLATDGMDVAAFELPEETVASTGNETAAPEKKRFQWGTEGRRGVYLEVGGAESGMDLGVRAVFDINPHFAVGGNVDYSFMNCQIEPPVTWDGAYFRVGDDHGGIYVIDALATAQGGTSVGLFYLYGFAGLGGYFACGGGGAAGQYAGGFALQFGAGADARFFKRHFALGLEWKTKIYFGLAARTEYVIVLGWHF